MVCLGLGENSDLVMGRGNCFGGRTLFFFICYGYYHTAFPNKSKKKACRFAGHAVRVIILSWRF